MKNNIFYTNFKARQTLFIVNAFIEMQEIELNVRIVAQEGGDRDGVGVVEHERVLPGRPGVGDDSERGAGDGVLGPFLDLLEVHHFIPLAPPAAGGRCPG